MKKMRIVILVFVIGLISTSIKADTDVVELYFSKKVKGNFEEVVQNVLKELKAVGFGLISEIDMDQKLAEKLKVEMKPYKILGVCSPSFAHKALQIDSNVGAFLPCKVIVKQLDKGMVEVVTVNPAILLGLMGNEKLNDMAEEIGGKIKSAIDKL